MKITILVPSGEERIPKIDEFYESCVNGRALQYLKGNDLTGNRMILKAHEVEVPDWHECWIAHKAREYDSTMRWREIPLPRPKKKVKKWQWVLKNIMSTRTNSTYFVSLKHYATSQDAVEDHFNVHAVLRINETEIEVEE